MTEEDKKLLLKDLYARVPYRVRCKCINGLGGGKTDHGILKFIGNCNGVISNYFEGIPIDSGFVNNVFYPIENIKPYLRPMSSMTEEEKEELRQEHLKDEKLYAECITRSEHGDNSMRGKVIPHFAADWCNEHHFDYRGLIEKDLALEAPENMYNIKIKIMESKWEILKKKQAENIAKLAETYPDDWFYASEMKKPEYERTGFAPVDGKCWRCGKNIAEGENGITPEKLGDYIITGCPHCNYSFCD